MSGGGPETSNSASDKAEMVEEQESLLPESSESNHGDASPADNSTDTVPPLLKLPPEITEPFILPHLGLKDLISVSQSCKTLQEYCSGARLFPASKLVLHVVRGDRANVQIMLNANPNLLRYKAAEVTAYSGLKVRNATALQAAFRAQDVDTGNKKNGEPKNDGMVEMLLPYFDKLKDGEAEKEKQINEEFPDGLQLIEEGENKGLPTAEPFDFSDIAEAITASSDADIKAELDDPDKTELGIPYVARNTPISNALREFRQAFREKSQQEKHFNPNHLLKAFAVVDSRQYANWSYEKQVLFCRQIIGYVQRYSPACYLQAFANIYPLKSVGHRTCRDVHHPHPPSVTLWGAALGLGLRDVCRFLPAALELCQAKTLELQKLIQRVQQQPESSVEHKPGSMIR